jgi:hypothetical protein
MRRSHWERSNIHNFDQLYARLRGDIEAGSLTAEV